MFHRILTATDFSASAHAACRFAADLARTCGAEVLLLHVAAQLPVLLSSQLKRDHEERLAQAEARLAAVARDIEAAGIRVDTRIEFGDPAHVIAHVAGEHGADLIVVGTHGQHALGVFVGSVAERLTRLAPCSLVIVRPDDVQAQQRAS